MATNTDIKSQHDTVIAAVSTLSDQLDSAKDAASAKQIVQKMQQLTNQANQLQHLLLAKATAAITGQTQKVTSAKADLDADIKKDASWANIVSSVNSLLTTVDQAIQVAKGVVV